MKHQRQHPRPAPRRADGTPKPWPRAERQAGRSRWQHRTTRRAARRLLVASIGIALAAAACITADESVTLEGGIASVRSQLPGADDTCAEKANVTAVKIRWDHDFSVARKVTQVPMTFTADRNVSLRLFIESEGLDQRVVRRPLTNFTMREGETRRLELDMGDVPLQGVSYATSTTVRVEVDREFWLQPPMFYHHYDSQYDEATVYDIDVLVSRFDGGQLAEDVHDVRGRVWDGLRFRSVTEMRRLEHLETALPAGIIFDTAPPDQNPADQPDFPPAPGPGTPGPTFDVQVDWRTAFIDALGHDDFIVGSYPHFDTQRTDASFAQYVIGHVPSDCDDSNGPCRPPCMAFSPQDSCVVVDQQGFLDDQGHTKLYDPVEGRTYLMWVYTNLHRGSPTTFDPTFEPTPMGGSAITPGSATAYVIDHDADENIIGPRTFRLNFWVPPSGSQVPNYGNVWTWVTALSHGAAIASLGLSRPDLVQDRRWRFNVNIDCPNDNPEFEDNACFSGGAMYLAGWTTSIPGEAGNMQFKTILAHELGHGVDKFGSGKPLNIQFPSEDTFSRFNETSACNCDHFTGSTDNTFHCLQSWETADVARQEGFAHYFAAELFNDASDGDCAFYYYKQVSLWRGGPGSILREANRMTPADRVVDCSKPGRMLASSNFPSPQTYPNGWRDDGCWDRNPLTNQPFTYNGAPHDTSQGNTQWDWLTFLWAIRHDSNNAISMQEHNDIVRDACDGIISTDCEFVWDGTNASGFTANSGFLPAAAVKFGAASQKYFLLVQEGDDHGVDEGGQ